MTDELFELMGEEVQEVQAFRAAASVTKELSRVDVYEAGGASFPDELAFLFDERCPTRSY